MWISGSPGAGKSAVASTLVSRLTRQGRLFSFFFFKRGDAILGDPTALWRTIASDLSRLNTDVKQCVLEFLNKAEIRDGDIRLHFDCMIEEALMIHNNKLSTNPPVIVIDALDECGLDDSQSSQRRILLDTLVRWSCLPQSCKLIVTSRDERLPVSFRDPQHCRRITLETGNSLNEETRDDIRIYLMRRFDDVRPNLGMTSEWPGEDAMNQLTERAGGLFIWAKTAMAFMEEKGGKPSDKLKLILAGDLGDRNDNVDTLYRQILNFNFDGEDDPLFDLFKAVVGIVIIAKTPLHRDDLKHFLGRLDEEGERQLRVILHNLSSVIDIDGLLRLRKSMSGHPLQHWQEQTTLRPDPRLHAGDEIGAEIQYLPVGDIPSPKQRCIGFIEQNHTSDICPIAILMSILGYSPL